MVGLFPDCGFCFAFWRSMPVGNGGWKKGSGLGGGFLGLGGCVDVFEAVVLY